MNDDTGGDMTGEGWRFHGSSLGLFTRRPCVFMASGNLDLNQETALPICDILARKALKMIKYG